MLLVPYCMLKLNVWSRQVSKHEGYGAFSISRLCLSSGRGKKILPCTLFSCALYLNSIEKCAKVTHGTDYFYFIFLNGAS